MAVNVRGKNIERKALISIIKRLKQFSIIYRIFSQNKKKHQKTLDYLFVFLIYSIDLFIYNLNLFHDEQI